MKKSIFPFLILFLMFSHLNYGAKPIIKNAEIFTLTTDKESEIICKEGTRIKIPANCFVGEISKKDITGTIQLSVTEYYKLSDLILARLSTTSNKAILESNGMINISITANNENCILKAGQEIEIGFPFLERKSIPMQLYSGQWTSNSVDWKLLNIQKKRQEFPDENFYVEMTPQYASGEDELLKDINTNVFYPRSAITRRKEGKVYVRFRIDENGIMKDLNVAKGVDTMLDKAAFYAISKLSKTWKAGRQNGKPVSVWYVVPIDFNLKKQGNQASTEMEDIIKNTTIYYGSQLKNEIGRYCFSISRLGWLNLGKLYKNAHQKIETTLQLKESDSVYVCAIFQNKKTIIAGILKNNHFVIPNIPQSEKVTIVAFKIVDNKVLLAIKESTIQKAGETLLEFQPVTMEKLKTEIEKLNNL